MKGTLVGIQKGTSKKGNAYTIVHYTCESESVVGVRAGNSFCPNYVNTSDLQIGNNYNFEFVNGSIGYISEI